MDIGFITTVVQRFLPYLLLLQLMQAKKDTLQAGMGKSDRNGMHESLKRLE